MTLPEADSMNRFIQKLKSPDQETLNGRCIMMEGLFNSLGNDIIGATTIMPLFLAYLGANLQLIGVFSSMQSVFSAVAPLLFGSIVAATRSKKWFSIICNGVARSAVVFISLGLMLGLPRGGEMILFFAVMGLFYLNQPVTGLAWNHLLGACVRPENRGRLLGTLYAVSGVITFLSSAIIKAIRASALDEGGQYAAIFLLGGVLLGCSVLFYLPLREGTAGETGKPQRIGLKTYLSELKNCYRNRMFRKTLFANTFSSLAVSVNAFFFIFAQNVLRLTADQISNLIVFQTLGLMLGGMITGRISQYLGVKRMLQCVEGLGILVPVMGLLATGSEHAFLFAAIGVFFIGFTKSGLIGFSAYILEIVPTEKTVYHIVARSLVLLPFSFAGALFGALISRFSNTPVFIAQIVLAAMALIGVSRLRLNVYRRQK